MILNINDQAPEFTAKTDGDGEISLKDLRGQMVVLYFYPKDDTSGCTQEALDFTEHLKEFEKLNTKIIGVSKDSVKKHDKFKAKYDLPLTLISDEEVKICEAYGVYVEKSMYGKKYMGIERTTLLINDSGKIIEIWRKVKVKDHVSNVLKTIQELDKTIAA